MLNLVSSHPLEKIRHQLDQVDSSISHVTQIDLPNNSQSGLKIVQDILKDVDDIAFMHLNAEDVVRNRLVGDIVTAYGNWDENISKSTFPIRSGKGDR